MLASTNIGCENIRMRILTQYLDCIFNRKLLKRFISKERNFTYGKYRHQIPESIKSGDTIKGNGSIFAKVLFANTLRLNGNHLQDRNMHDFFM